MLKINSIGINILGLITRSCRYYQLAKWKINNLILVKFWIKDGNGCI